MLGRASRSAPAIVRHLLTKNARVGAFVRATQRHMGVSSAAVVSRRANLRLHNAVLRPGSGVLVRALATTVEVPTLAESISEGTVMTIHKNVGDYVQADEVVFELETEKVTVDVPSPVAGKLISLHASVDEDVVVGQKLFEIDETAAPEEAAASAPAPAAESKEPAKEPAAAPKPSPSAKEDKPSAAAPAPAKPAAPAPSAKPAATEPVRPLSVGERTERRVKMSKMRAKIAQRLKESQNTNAMLTTFNEIDMSNIMDVRSKYKEAFEKKHGVKLGFMSAFVKASTAALIDQPAVNAVIDGNEILYRDYVDISIAVASPTGLVVPVLRDCQNMSFADVEKTIAMYGEKARNMSMAMEDMAGGTFTVSNGGVFGSMMGTPIINPPQSAILGMHATKMRPMVVDGKIEPRPVMYVALTYDHRLVDGREAVTFLKQIKESIEDPVRLLLDV